MHTRKHFLLPLAALLAAPLAQAATITWDPAGGGASDGAGAWLDTGKWWDGGTNVDWTSGDDATFGNGGAGGAVSLASPTTANSVTLDPFTGRYDLGTNGQTLTVTNGITANIGVGETDFEGTIDNGGTDLTVDILEATPADRGKANIYIRQGISGAGGLVKNGPGALWLTGGTLSYGGDTIVNGGILRAQTSNYVQGLPGNLELNGGIVEAYWGNTVTRTLGTGSGEIQITGGESGFSQHGGNTITVRLNNSTAFSPQWGTATFNPSVLVFQSIASNSNSKVDFNNGLDLNGAPREIRVNQGNYTGVYAEIDGLITNTDAGNASGLTKSGAGMLILQKGNNPPNRNDYDGPTIVTEGVLALGTGWSNAQGVPGGISSTTGGTSNLEINGGNVRLAYYLRRPLGSGPTDVQLTGGVSGFSHVQSDTYGRITFNNNASTEVVWGSASFNPTAFEMNRADAKPNQVVNLQNDIDLNGADRTVATNSTLNCDAGRVDNNNGNMVTTGGRLTGDIRNSQGTAAGLIKTGPGHLQLTGANTYDGGTTINEGTMEFTKIVAMPATGTVAVNDGTTLVVAVGGAGEWTTGASGNGTVGGLLAGLGGQAPSTVSFTGTTGLGLSVSGSQTYSGVISSTGNVAVQGGGTLELTGDNTFTGDIIVDGGATLILSGDNSGASGSIRIINGFLEASVANLPGGGVTYDSPGNNPAILKGSGAFGPTIGSSADVYWNNNGGFAATSSAFTVTPNAGAPIDWSANNGFRGKKLMLGASDSTAAVEIPNNIDLDADRTVRLFNNTGSSDDVSILSGDIVESGGAKWLYVEGTGTLALTGTNVFGSASNRGLRISNGAVVRAVDGTGLPTTAVLDLNQGILESSGTFARDCGSGNTQVFWRSWGGFSAHGGTLSVNLNSGATIDWNANPAGFRGQELRFGSETSDNVVTLQNNIDLKNNRTVRVYDNPDTTADYTVFSGILANGDGGNRELNKRGTGKLLLNGVNTYTGQTRVHEGTLGGSGTVAGKLRAEGNSRLAPGASAGTLTVLGNLEIDPLAGNSNGKLEFELDTIAASDQIAVGGTINIGSGALDLDDFEFTDLGGLQNGTYKLITSANPVNGTLGATTNGTLGSATIELQISVSTFDIELVVSGLVAASPYDSWAGDNGLDPNWTGTPDDPMDGSPDGDPDGDGNDNLYEYGVGLDPTTSDNAALTVTSPTEFTPGNPIVVVEHNPFAIKMLYVRHKDPVTAGVTYTPKFSDSGGSFVPDPANPTPSSEATEPGDYEVVSVPFLLFGSDGKKAESMLGLLEVAETP